MAILAALLAKAVLASPAPGETQQTNAPANETNNRIIIRQGAYETFYDLPLIVNWPLTFMCNYHCSYCFGQDKLDNTKFVPFHKMLNAIDNLAALHRPAYEFGIIGGEPTVYPHFIQLLTAIGATFKNRLSKSRIFFCAVRGAPSRDRKIQPITQVVASGAESSYDASASSKWGWRTWPERFSSLIRSAIS